MLIRLSSHGGCIAELESYVKDLFSNHKLNPELYPNILISLTEAVNNAIKHGNRYDRSKMVSVRALRKSGYLKCLISDEGKGFDYDNLPDPTAPENVEKIGGRGVFLMTQLSDRVEFRNNGSTVELVFDL